MRYGPSGFIGWHHDGGCKLSFSVVLQAADAGGSMEFKTGDGVLDINAEVGELVAFESSRDHRITEITAGERVSLVGWLEGE